MDQFDNTTESWKPVVGWEGVYEVSSFGRVKRIRILKNHPYPRLCKIQKRTNGYSFVILQRDGFIKNVNVHVAVAAAFIGSRPQGYQINHRDGCKTNNIPDNLEYVTPSENAQHSYRIGLQKPQYGDRSGYHKLSEKQVETLRPFLGVLTNAKIARIYGVSQGTIRFIRVGKTWRHTSAP